MKGPLTRAFTHGCHRYRTCDAPYPTPMGGTPTPYPRGVPHPHPWVGACVGGAMPCVCVGGAIAYMGYAYGYAWVGGTPLTQGPRAWAMAKAWGSWAWG